MALPTLPLLLYAQPLWAACPARVFLYLHEKKIPSYLVKVLSAEDAQGSERYPAPPNATIPKLAIAKSSGAASSNDPDGYIWLTESNAILEYLEDLCDANPSLTTVPSLRGGSDLSRRAVIRAMLCGTEDAFMSCGLSLPFASAPFNKMVGVDAKHIPSAHSTIGLIRKRVLTPLDALLAKECDFEGIERDQEAAASIGDIASYAVFRFYRDVHGVQMAKGFANIERLIATFDKRHTAQALVPVEEFPSWVLAFKEWDSDEVW